MGNPGVNNGVPTEADGKLGISGVPAGGREMKNKLMPGGSPSAAERGVMMGGGMRRRLCASMWPLRSTTSSELQ